MGGDEGFLFFRDTQGSDVRQTKKRFGLAVPDDFCHSLFNSYLHFFLHELKPEDEQYTN